MCLWLMVGLIAWAATAADIEKLDSARLPRLTIPASIVRDQSALHVRVLVLEFNPLIPAALHAAGDPDAGPKGLREVAGWNDATELAAGYLQDVCDASGGLVQYEIAEWLIVRRFQRKTDGFVYTPESYIKCLKGGTVNNDCWRQPDALDYPHAVAEFDLVRRVESGEIDEVWMMGLPYFGYWESCMVGKDAYFINGGVYDQVPCKRRFVIMGFNVERGVAEMLHDLAHRTEATMERIYGGWEVDQLTTSWARFAANQKQSGKAAVGTCHYPPNAERDYDYANAGFVVSTADDWLHYPDLTGRSRSLNCDEWRGPHETSPGKPDFHRNYQCWWFAHLPRAPGIAPDGRLSNWWEYVFDFNAYDERGRPRSTRSPLRGPEGGGGCRRPA